MVMSPEQLTLDIQLASDRPVAADLLSRPNRPHNSARSRACSDEGQALDGVPILVRDDMRSMRSGET